MDKFTQTIDIVDGLRQDFREITGSNPFPVEVFPKPLQDLIIALNKTLNFPLDYSATSLLFAVSVATGNKVRLRVKNGWTEKTSLFLILIGRTGDIKSHTLSFFLDPLIKRDKNNFDEYREKKREYERLTPEEKENVTFPILKQCLLNDFTPEALIKMLFYNQRGIGLYFDEMAGFFKSFNRYHKGNEEEVYLSLWAGKPIFKNRTSGEEMRVDDPKIDLIGTMQESILPATFQDQKMNNGFIDRFLFVFPDRYVDNKWNDRELDISMIRWYKEFIDEIFYRSDQDHSVLIFDSEAKNYLYRWQNNQPTNFEFDFGRGISVKLQQYVLRFSILIEVMFSVCNRRPLVSISLNSVRAAIQLRDYFYETASRVFEKIHSNYLDTLTTTQRKAFELLPETFKTSEAKEIILPSAIMKERSLMTFLKDRRLFTKIAHGFYQKELL